MLAVRHDLCGHGSGFGGFLGREKPLSLSLNEIRWGSFLPPVEFFSSMFLQHPVCCLLQVLPSSPRVKHKVENVGRSEMVRVNLTRSNCVLT